MSKQRTLEYVNCVLCGQNDTRLLFVGKDRLHGKEGRFDVVQCKKCGLAYINPRPNEDEIRYYYPEEYAAHAEMTWRGISMNVGIMNEGFGKFNAMKNRMKALVLRTHYGYNAERIYGLPDQIKFLPPWVNKLLVFPFFIYIRNLYYRIPRLVNNGRILDIGCGSGGYVRLLHKLGWEAYGIDMSGRAIARIPKLPKLHTFIGGLHDQNFQREHFDLVTMWHTLEHMHDPLMVLREAQRIMKHNGIIYICVPNIKSFAAKIFKDRWLGFDVPRHLYHFSPEVFEAILRTVGFRAITIRHLPFRSYIPMGIRFWLEEKQKSTKTVDNFTVRRLCFWMSRVFALFGHGEIILVQAQKE